MKPTIESLLQRGYFPKELPPPFNTFSFGSKYNLIKTKWEVIRENPDSTLKKETEESSAEFNQRKKKFRKEFKEIYVSSFCSKYSIAKGKLSRRYIGIPNPMNYINQAETVVEAWDDIMSVIDESKFSQSKPVFQKALYKRTFTTSCKGVSNFLNSTLEASFDKRVELKLDLSKFYPTIYTHSISWAMLGKEVAKTFFNMNKDEFQCLLDEGNVDALIFKKADDIDVAMRNSQGKQTIGIPIGPDISFVIAELIVSRIDIYIAKYDPEVTGCRYYDDYYIYTDNLGKAENLLKYIQGKLNEFGLEINESKVSIREFPFEFEEKFSTDLSKFSFSKNFEYSIKLYFNLIWHFAEKNPLKTGQIFRYALKVFDPSVLDRIKITEKYNWIIFENLLLKTIMLDPTILNIACNILESYKSWIDSESKNKLLRIVIKIFEENIPLNQHLEVSWALWLCKKNDLPINVEFCVKIFNSKDSISCLILLDIINGRPALKKEVQIQEELSRMNNSFSERSLFSEDWLLLYEGVKKGWLDRKDLIDKNLFFSNLYSENIEFYDSNFHADFLSEEYIFSKQELIVTEDIKAKAKAKAQFICNEIFSRKSNEIKEEEEEEWLEANPWVEESELYKNPNFHAELRTLDEIEKELKSDFEEENIYQDIYNSILSNLVRTEPIDEETMILEYISKLQYDIFYR